MAIADRLNKLKTDIEDTYQAINEIGGTIPSDKNTNNIPEAIRSVYDNLPKVSDTETNVSLSPTLKGRLGIVPKGNTYQESTTGKNLIDFATISFSNANNGSGIREGTIFTVNGNSSDTWGGIRFAQSSLQLEPNTTYTFSATIQSTTSSSGSQVFISSSMSSTGISILGNMAKENERSIATFTTPTTISDNADIRLYPRSNGGTAFFTDLQLEKGSSATSYEPYTGGQASPSPSYPQEIQSATGTQKVVVSGKNLFDASQFSDFTTTIRFVELHLKPNTNYTLSSNIPGWGTNIANLFIITSTGSPTTANDGVFPNSPRTITSLSDGIIRIGYRDNASSLTDEATKYWYMLNEGSTATPYQPYQEPQEVDIELGNIELNKIGDYEDYIDGTPDNWVLYKNIGKVVLDGSETWVYQNNVFVINVNDILQQTAQEASVIMLSDYYQGVKTNYRGSIADNSIAKVVGANIQIAIKNSNFTSATDFKTWLSTNNTEVLYVLAEPQPTPITEEPLVSQLNELYYLQSYNDTTNIDVTGNLPMRITASAIKGA